jgi:hypothetical protein
MGKQLVTLTRGPTARVAQRGRTDGIQKAHQGHHCDPCK